MHDGKERVKESVEGREDVRKRFTGVCGISSRALNLYFTLRFNFPGVGANTALGVLSVLIVRHVLLVGFVSHGVVDKT